MMSSSVRDVPHRRRRGFALLQGIGWGTYAAATYLAILPTLPPGARLTMIAVKLYRAGLGAIASLVLHRIYRHRPLAVRTAGLLAIIAGLASATLGTAWYLLLRIGTAATRPPGVPLVDWAALPHQTLDYTLTLLAWSALYFGFRLWRDLEERDREIAEAGARIQETELRMLRYQLDPHFLFNALNSIRASIEPSATVPREMIDELSDFLRHSLGSRAAALVPLHDELAAARSYLAIERLRFGDRLETEISADPGAEQATVPGFLLHPLVENAVKHGRATTDGGPLAIRIGAAVTAHGLEIEVANTGRLDQRKEAEAAKRAGFGIGLDNLRARLESFYPAAASFTLTEDESWVRARVRIAARAPSHA